MKNFERAQGERPVEIAMAFAQGSAQQDHIGLGKAVVDIVGDGDIGGDNRDVATRGKGTHELEGSGTGVDNDRVAVFDEPDGCLRDSLFGGDVEVDTLVLDGDGQRFLQRNGTAVRAPQLSRRFEGVKVGSGGDGGNAKGPCELCDLYGCRVVEHGENGCAPLLGKGMGGVAHSGLRLFRRNVQILFCFIFVLRKKKHIVCFVFMQTQRVGIGMGLPKQAVPKGREYSSFTFAYEWRGFCLMMTSQVESGFYTMASTFGSRGDARRRDAGNCPVQKGAIMLVTTKEMLLDAKKNHYGVGAFNVENLEFVMAVLKAAEETKSPVIMQTTPGTIKTAGLDYFYGMVKAAAERTEVPVALHLDHGDGYNRCMQALRCGYTSVMIDGSHELFEDNIALTKLVADAGAAMGVPVEAELGKVGGKEDDGPTVEGENPYTDPDEAVEFVERTGCTSLAIGVGTAHGVYVGTPHIQQDVVKAIASKLDIPLVLHGTSGVPDEQVAEAIKNGICKVNYATELRQAFTKGYMRYMAENPECFDPKKPGREGMAEITDIVKIRMENLGSVGRA